MEEVSFLGYIRWYNERNVNKILFRGLNFKCFVDTDGCKVSINREKLIDELNNRSSNKKTSISMDLVENFIIHNRNDNLLNLCNGHDVTKVLSLVVGKKVSDKTLCQHLRLSFQMEDFMKTTLYSHLKKWQDEHGFDLLEDGGVPK